MADRLFNYGLAVLFFVVAMALMSEAQTWRGIAICAVLAIGAITVLCLELSSD